MDNLLWPLERRHPLLPDEPGQFGIARKNDVHTGVDLYAEINDHVVAMEDGTVVLIEPFTGAHVVQEADKSPWWNDTWAVLVEGKSGVIAYGEVFPCVETGIKVRAGERIGQVIPVLRTFKGRPMVMLHLELMRHGSRSTVWWRNGDPKPDCLIDPMPLLLSSAGSHATTFDMDLYDGIQFRDPTAKMNIQYKFGARLRRA